MENYYESLSSIFQNCEFLSQDLPVRRVKIMCTINPDFSSSKIEEMIKAGMDIARIKFSFNDQSTYKKMIDNIREAAKTVSNESDFPVHIPIAVDTKGPEIQTGMLEGGDNAQIFLESGAVITLTTDENFKSKGNTNILFVDYKDLTNVVDPGAKLYIDNCSIMLVIDKVVESNLICTVVNGGWLGSYKDIRGLGIFRKKLDFTSKDISDLEFAISEKVDCIMNSYTMGAESIIKIKQMLSEHKMTGSILVFAVVENKFGAKTLQEILNVADGLVVSRVGISVDSPNESVFYYHMALVALCNQLGKPLVSYDRIMLSTAQSPMPDYADVSDLGHLILQGVDCLLLCSDVSKGEYLVDSIKVTEKMCREAEICMETSNNSSLLQLTSKGPEISLSVAHLTVQSSMRSKASAIVAIPIYQKVLKHICRFHPQCPVIVVASKPELLNNTKFHRSLYPILFDEPIGSKWEEYLEKCYVFGIQYGKHLGIVERDDLVVMVSSWKQTTGLTNTVRVRVCDI